MSDGSQFMNEVLRSGRYRGTRTGGLIDRLPGTDMTQGRRERLDAAEVRFEAAVKAGDEAGREMADAEIDAILDEGRAARSEATAQAEPAVGFDGGVRRMGKRQPPGLYHASGVRLDASPNALLRAAFAASAERSRGGDPIPRYPN